MPTYVVAGIGLATELDLPELPTVSDDERPVRGWTLVEVEALSLSPTTVEFEHETRDGRLWCRVGRTEGTTTLEFPGRLDVLVRPDDRRVELAVAPGLAASTLRHLVIDQIVPHLLRLDGEVVLHASAVVVDGGALAFLGPSGIGKSSLAGGFVAAGADLLADDFVPLREQEGRYLTTVAYPGLRLWPDAADHLAGNAEDLAPVTDYQAKRRWPVPSPDAGADVPLAALVALGLPPHDPAAPDCEVGLVRGTDAFTLVYGQVVRVVRGDRARQAAELDWVARLVEAVPVVLVEHRRAYDLLPAVVAEIRAALGRLAETGWGLGTPRS